jgi:hypothetical protein
MTPQGVADERRISDESYGRFCRRNDDLCRRVREGTLEFEGVMAGLQCLIEGKDRSNSFSWPWAVGDKGNIHFTLTSNGLTRTQWEQHLERRGWLIGGYARQVLRRASEAPTSGVTYNIVVCPAKKISASGRITKKICATANKKGWLKPHWEVACLIRDRFTDEQLEQMGLWYIVTMHKLIKDSDGGSFLLYSHRHGAGRQLNAGYEGPGGHWDDGGGFAFVVPQELVLKSKRL